jgi:hypothetical protein
VATKRPQQWWQIWRQDHQNHENNNGQMPTIITRRLQQRIRQQDHQDQKGNYNSYWL